MWYVRMGSGSAGQMIDIVKASERMGVATNEEKWREFDHTQKYKRPSNPSKKRKNS